MHTRTSTQLYPSPRLLLFLVLSNNSNDSFLHVYVLKKQSSAEPSYSSKALPSSRSQMTGKNHLTLVTMRQSYERLHKYAGSTTSRLSINGEQYSKDCQ